MSRKNNDGPHLIGGALADRKPCERDPCLGATVPAFDEERSHGGEQEDQQCDV